ncbi:hypothetical protein [Azohydromonas aeria]|uniref:hypothetical protein n=1 Tax=Azohydromonas aeria TaxID=2590212 RepID=UPI0012FA90D2|nr:hypothetical protein [Azohydromonas aeria]
MDTYDFSRLTPSQQTLLTFQGWSRGCGRPQPHPLSVKKLLDRGLLAQRTVREDQGALALEIHEYDVPLAVHRAWCEHCAKRAKSETVAVEYPSDFH